tara:strand:- start:16971 stop:17621 length:651 start_codon:yes stop_codon:yes gene_type:complete
MSLSLGKVDVVEEPKPGDLLNETVTNVLGGRMQPNLTNNTRKVCGKTLVLGGSRSGKSAFAESLFQNCENNKIYIATAQAMDTEMASRIDKHRQQRDELWQTIEEPLDIITTIKKCNITGNAFLVDCLTIWLSNLIHAGRDVERESHKLSQYLANNNVDIVMVSNEVGLGIIPENALARQFSDYAGKLNQLMAQTAENVFFISAGLPISLKTPYKK